MVSERRTALSCLSRERELEGVEVNSQHIIMSDEVVCGFGKSAGAGGRRGVGERVKFNNSSYVKMMT